MSKIAGHKVQLALSVLKGRREEAKSILPFTKDTPAYYVIEARIEQLNGEIETFENNLRKQGELKND